MFQSPLKEIRLDAAIVAALAESGRPPRVNGDFTPRFGALRIS